MNKPIDHRPAELEALQARLALRLTAALDEQPLAHDIGERLRVARERALAHARGVRAEPATAVVATGRGAAALAGGSPWWTRLASLAPLLVLVAGLVLIQHMNNQAQIDAAAEIDAALLADELPPAAYGDPGFSQYLRDVATP